RRPRDHAGRAGGGALRVRGPRARVPAAAPRPAVTRRKGGAALFRLPKGRWGDVPGQAAPRPGRQGGAPAPSSRPGPARAWAKATLDSQVVSGKGLPHPTPRIPGVPIPLGLCPAVQLVALNPDEDAAAPVEHLHEPPAAADLGEEELPARVGLHPQAVADRLE